MNNLTECINNLAYHLFRTRIFRFGSNEALGSQMTLPQKAIIFYWNLLQKPLKCLHWVIVL